MSISLARCRYMHFPFAMQHQSGSNNLNHEGTEYSKQISLGRRRRPRCFPGGRRNVNSAPARIGLVHQHSVNHPATGLGREAGRDAIVSLIPVAG
jgi:hypothetical protein